MTKLCDIKLFGKEVIVNPGDLLEVALVTIFKDKMLRGVDFSMYQNLAFSLEAKM